MARHKRKPLGWRTKGTTKRTPSRKSCQKWRTWSRPRVRRMYLLQVLGGIRHSAFGIRHSARSFDSNKYLFTSWGNGIHRHHKRKRYTYAVFGYEYHIYAGTTFGLLGMQFWYRLFNILCALYFLIGLQRWISFQKILSSHWTNCVSQCALEDLSYEPRFGKDSTWIRRDDFCEQNP